MKSITEIWKACDYVEMKIFYGKTAFKAIDAAIRQERVRGLR